MELGMSGFGEIRRWSPSPTLRCGCGPTSARRTWASSRRSTRLPPPRRRSSRARPGPGVRGQCRRPPRHGASRDVRRAGDHVRRRRAGRRVGQRRRALGFAGTARVSSRGGSARLRRRCSARPTSPTSRRPRPWPSRPDSTPTTSRRAWPTSCRRPIVARWSGCRRLGGHRRRLQLQSIGAHAGAGDVGDHARRVTSPCSARCWNWATQASAITRSAAGGGGPGRGLVIAIGGAPARALADAARAAAGVPDVHHVATAPPAPCSRAASCARAMPYW